MKPRNKLSVSVVMPCLNEEKGVGECVKTALRVMKKNKIKGEVIVVDNSSSDNSAAVAIKAGARMVRENRKGYGSAYLAGLKKARGEVFIIGDCDGTYDFNQIPDFIKKIEAGYDFVNGSRIKGQVAPGAFRFSHRFIAVPLLTGILNIFFKTSFSDAHCGMRAFSREAYKTMSLRCRGMEFASEMIMKAASTNLKTTEIPIRYLPRIGESKLMRFRDAWRHIRFMLLFAPTYLFIIPGIILLVFGLSSLFLMLPGPFWLFGHGFDIHAMILVSALAILGMNILTLGLFAKIFALYGDIELVKNPLIKLFIDNFDQEDWLKLGLLFFLAGLGVSFYVFWLWVKANFGAIFQIRAVILAITLMILGAQVIFASFFASLMIDRHRELI